MKLKDFKDYDISENGVVTGPRTVLKPFMGRGGYLKVCLSENNRRRWVYIHRLVCESFIPNPLGKKEINHIDGCKTNNSKDNLEWVTRSENNIHAFKTGLKKGVRGEQNKGHKLTNSQVLQIRNLRGILPQRELEKIYGVSHSHISKIQRGIDWKYVEVSHV